MVMVVVEPSHKKFNGDDFITGSICIKPTYHCNIQNMKQNLPFVGSLECDSCKG